MDTWIEITIAVILSGLGLVSLGANILGLPGNWALVGMAVLCWFLRSPEQATFISLAAVVVMTVGALIGEALEFAAGALGASRVGGSRRGTALAIVGSIAGAIAGLVFGSAIPIPLVGSLVGSLVLGAGGAFGGAVVGERWAGKDWDSSFQVGNAAFWGRLMGTVGKAACGTLVLGIFLIAIWW